MKIYKKELRDKTSDLEETFVRYYKHPDSYPDYKDEWLIYWENRSKELERIGVDPLNHDFSHEWKVYFLGYLKNQEAKRYTKIKKDLFEKYSQINKNQWRDERDSSYDRRSSSYGRHESPYSRHESPYKRRNSHSSFRASAKNRYKSRSQKYRDYQRSSSRNYESSSINKRIKIERFESVYDVCSEILSLDQTLKFDRERILELQKKAMNTQDIKQREYTMSESEYESMLDLNDDFVNMIKTESQLPSMISNRLKKVNSDLIRLLNQWKTNNIKQNLIQKKLKFISTQKSDKKVSPKNDNFTWNSPKKILTNTNYDWSISPISNEEDQKMFNMQSTSMRSLTPPIVPNVEFKELDNERKNVNLQLSGDYPMSEYTASSIFDSQQQRLIFDENLTCKTEKSEEIFITADDFTDQTLIDLFKNFESSEEDLRLLQQIMTEIELTNEPRFNRLKEEMENIQNSFENVNGDLDLVNGLSIEETVNNIKHEEIEVDREKLYDPKDNFFSPYNQL